MRKNSQAIGKSDNFNHNAKRKPRWLILAASALALGGLLATDPAKAAIYHWDVVPGATGPGNNQIDDGQGVWDTVTGNWTTDGGANNILWTDGGGSTNSVMFGAGAAGTGGTVSLNTTVYPTGITFNAAADGTSYNILNGTNPGIINWNNYGNSIGGANLCFNINVIGTNTTSTIAALLTNSQDAAGNYAGRFFYKTGTGKLIITGGLMCGDLNGGKNTQDAGLFVNGGTDASNESRMEIAAGTANTYSGNTFMYRTRVGNASGYNVLSITGFGQLQTGAIVIGENSTGYNQFNVSAPGTVSNPTVITTGDNSALVIGGGGGPILGLAASSNNSVSISNGAYFKSAGGSGTVNGGLGLNVGSNNNSMIVAGFNAANPTEYSTYTQAGQRFYIGQKGNNNQLQVNSGGKMTLRVMQIGDGGSGNSAIIDGTGISPSTLTVNEDLLIGDTTNSSNNSLTVRNGGFLSSNTRSGKVERSLSVGEGSNANGNSVTVTGSGTTWTDNGYQVLISTNTINSNLTNLTPLVSTSSNNSINIFDGATANINTGVSIAGTDAGTDTGTSHSSLNLGNHAGISTANIGSTRDGAVNLYVASAQLNFNDGRLTANVSGNLVYGLGTVTLTHTGYINTQGNTSTVSSQIIDSTPGGGGNLTKEGTGTLIFSNANNTYSGTTTVNNGILKLSAANNNNIANSAIINVTGGVFLDVSGLSGANLALSSGQTLKGNGTVMGGNVSVPSGAILSPGDAVGTLNFSGDQTWMPGGHYQWEVGQVIGSGLQTSGADLLAIGGQLDLSNLNSSNQFILNLTGPLGDLGNVTGWDPNQNYSWVIASATNFTVPLINFSDLFALQSDVVPGTFSISLSDAQGGGQEMVLNYTGVPTPTAWFGGVALGALMAVRRWRRV